MKANYKLIGLSRPKSGTCKILGNNDETFNALLDMEQDRCDALFNWAKEEANFWSQTIVATVECDIIANGFPVNPKIIEVAF